LCRVFSNKYPFDLIDFVLPRSQIADRCHVISETFLIVYLNDPITGVCVYSMGLFIIIILSK